MREKITQKLVQLNLAYLKAKNRVEEKLEDNHGDGALQTVIGILITVIIGAALLFALKTLFGNGTDGDGGIISTVLTQVKELFTNNKASTGTN